ncbi:MAG: NAD-dependent epimerase/dehydratase family protein [Azoarcus sp.]|jgi:nucleoside-diphosphate-sugar epimerase|nr:NAD-dependent epimerase/dehydratase family protein [Azoarcus sp.]
MKALVIGGTNFIGPVLTRQLAQSGHEVAVFHRRISPEIQYGQIQGDCNDADDLRRALEAVAPDVILHMVAWSQKQIHVLEQALHGGKMRAVIASSVDVYKAYEVLLGLSDAPVVAAPCDEQAPLRDVLYPYRGRVEADFAHDYEKILMEKAAMRSAVLDAVILRLGMVYGRNDPRHRFLEPIQKMRQNARRIELPKDAAGFRASMCHVEDVAHGIILAMESHAAREIYNLAARRALSGMAWHRRIARLMHWHGDIVVDETAATADGMNYAQHLVADTGKIRKQLGYKERLPLDEGLAGTIRWELENIA